jgi:hypothetical protein
VQEITSPYEVHPTLVTHGKKQLLEGAAEIFSNGQRVAADADEELKAELYQALGFKRRRRSIWESGRPP